MIPPRIMAPAFRDYYSKGSESSRRNDNTSLCPRARGKFRQRGGAAVDHNNNVMSRGRNFESFSEFSDVEFSHGFWKKFESVNERIYGQSAPILGTVRQFKHAMNRENGFKTKHNRYTDTTLYIFLLISVKTAVSNIV